MDRRKKGVILIFSAALLFSLGGLCVKMIPWSPLAINGARCLISLAVLGVFAAVSKHRLKSNKWVLLGAAGVFGTNVLYIIANKLTTAANAIVLQFTAPVFVIIISAIFLRSKPKKLDIITCAVVFAGIVCFFVDGLSSGGMTGNIIALVSGLTYAMVFMLGSLPGGDPLSSAVIGQGAGALLGLPFVFFESDFGAVPIAFILVLGLLQMGLAYVCFCTGIANTPPVSASLITGIEPVLNPVWVAVFYGETVSAISIVGGVIVVGAIVIYNILKARKGAIV